MGLALTYLSERIVHGSINANVDVEEPELFHRHKVIVRGALGALDLRSRVGLVVLGVGEGTDVAWTKGIEEVCCDTLLSFRRVGRHEHFLDEPL